MKVCSDRDMDRETEAEMGTTVRKGAEMQTETWTEMGMRTEIETKRKKKRCENIP